MQQETYTPDSTPPHYYFPGASGEAPPPLSADIKDFGGAGLTYSQPQLSTTSFPLQPDRTDQYRNGLLAGGLFTADSYCASSSSPSLMRNLYRGGQAATVSGSGGTVPSQDEKAMMALRNHKEAEKRRRERINSHLDRLRSLLPCSTKTDKATLLAQVVQRVRELNKEAAEVMTQHQRQAHQGGRLTIPSQTDEFSVDHDSSFYDSDDDQKLVLRAFLCCEDRSDLLSDLMEMVSSLNLKTVRAEMLSLGGRVTNVLVLSGDRCRAEEYVAFLEDALKGIVQRSGSGGDRSKRRRRLDAPHM